MRKPVLQMLNLKPKNWKGYLCEIDEKEGGSDWLTCDVPIGSNACEAIVFLLGSELAILGIFHMIAHVKMSQGGKMLCNKTAKICSLIGKLPS